MKTIKPKLRFAALIRVSTERQAKKGESLRTQKAELQETVKQLEGKIVVWYGGQEHATPGYEKTEINRMLEDVQKASCPWDAIIVTHADRWSRDNEQSKKGLRILRDNKKLFFNGGMEMDLFNPAHTFLLGVYAEVNELIALSAQEKSIKNRIGKAKRGCAVAGKLPYGRTYNKKMETWGIDKEKKELIQEAAQRYLEDESLSDLADEYKMSSAGLHRILTKHCGVTWMQKFNSDKLNIHAEVKTKIPRLLDENIIKAIKQKAQANKTYTHGHAIHQYLLSRMVFCGRCDYAMYGQTCRETNRYYRHVHASQVKHSCSRDKSYLKADELEDIVLRHLFEMFGNPVKVQKAIQDAIPNLDKIKADRKRLERIDRELIEIKKSRDRIIKHVVKGTFTEEQVEKEQQKLVNREEKLKDEQDRICENLSNHPNIVQIKKMSKKVSDNFHKQTNVKLMLAKKYANREYEQMTDEEKRALIELVFSGKTASGKRMGVYIEWGEGDSWSFSIHGHLIDEEGLLPLSDSMKQAVFGDFGGSGSKQQDLLSAQNLSHSKSTLLAQAFPLPRSSSQRPPGPFRPFLLSD